MERVVTQPETLVRTQTSDDADESGAAGDDLPAAPGPNRYQRLDEIGRGGMATVYSVRDPALLRVSAMKVLAPPRTSQAQVARFVREARITAQLDHPNIVPVHEIGRDADGNLYFTMKRVEGRTLQAWIAELGHPPAHTDDFRRMLESFLRVCDAIAFAHSRGVIHCDIKPANIMVGLFGQVYVMDWGVAQISTERSAADVMKPRSLTGTPAYMSPEQASRQPIDERADIFALGALLYAMLTGRAPYNERDARAAVTEAVAAAVTFPAAQSGLPTLLCEIALRAMSKDPDQRHQNVLALRQDVEAAMHTLPFSTETYLPGARIVVEGEPGDSAYIVVSGNCVAYKTVDGERRVLRRLPAGSVFGEMAVLSGKPRTATVEAETDVVVSVVSRAQLERNLGVGTRFGAFVVALAERFRELDDRRDG